VKQKNSALALGALLLALCPAAEAQQTGKVWRIGYLSAGSRLGAEAREEAFRQGLRELGYVEGQNITIEYRYAESNRDKLSVLTGELVSLKVDLIVAVTTFAASAAKKTTGTIPIVMRLPGDPVEDGLVASLARPGGNVTGVTSIIIQLGGKRLELLKELVPALSRMAILWRPGGQYVLKRLKEMEAESRSLGIQFRPIEVRLPNEIDEAFRTASKEHTNGITTMRDPFINSQRKRIVDLAIKSRLPSTFDDTEFVEAGGLMSYGANLIDLQRRLATFVDKIFKGTKPADLPVEQPTKFEFVINLKTAKQIGLIVPPNVLARADKVIR
jgi:putative tryptophan/tyrosine transport system substrate-binding protein